MEQNKIIQYYELNEVLSVEQLKIPKFAYI